MSEVTFVALRTNNTTVGIEYYRIKCQKHISRIIPYIFPRSVTFYKSGSQWNSKGSRKTCGCFSNAKEMV